MPQPADIICCNWSGRKNVSVALLGTRSTVVPSAYSGLNVFTTWLGVESTMMVCPNDASEKSMNTPAVARTMGVIFYLRRTDGSSKLYIKVGHGNRDKSSHGVLRLNSRRLFSCSLW